MKEFLNQLTGGIEPFNYAAGFVFALIGAILSLRIHAQKRDKQSPNTPFNFSFKFMIKDNLNRLLTGFLFTFIAFRFAPEILQQDFSMFLAFLVGLLNDRVAGIISKLELSARK
jgi:hypothetical protein